MPDNKDVPAYPYRDNDGVIHQGMTLRQWYAGQALAVSTAHNSGLTPHERIQLAIKIADAMIAELGRKDA